MDRASDSSDLSFEHSPHREVIRLAWPICVSMVSYSTMSIVDTLFVGHLGAPTLAGVGLATVLSFVVLVFGMGLLQGVKVLVSQAVGAGRSERAAGMLGAGVIFAAGIGVLSTLCMFLLLPVLPALSASPAAAAHAHDYLVVRALGATLTYGFWATKEWSYGLGDSRSPMVASVIANLGNIALDYLFIMGLGWGAAGAAWATVFCSGLELGILVYMRRQPGWLNLRDGQRWLRPLANVGAPLGLQFTVEVGAFALLTILISAMSEEEMAAHQVALSVIRFGFLPAFAIADAASVLAGRAVGAGRDDLVLKVAKAALRISGIYSVLFTVVLVAGGSLIAAGFTADPAVTASTLGLLRVAAWFQMADAANMVARCVLRGTGDVAVPAYVAVGLSWALTPPLTWLLGYQLGMGAFGGWLGITAEVFASTAILWWRLARGGWMGAAAASRKAVAL